MLFEAFGLLSFKVAFLIFILILLVNGLICFLGMRKFKRKNPGKLAGICIIAALLPYLCSMMGWLDVGLMLALIFLLVSSAYLALERFLTF